MPTQQFAVTGLNLLAPEGKYINAKTSDAVILLTILTTEYLWSDYDDR